jgi:hypothetical protein
MCGGPTDTQSRLQDEEANFYATQVSAYNSAYKNFSEIQDRLNAQFAPILAKGPNQYGFDKTEDQTLRTQATEGTAQGYAKAARAVHESLAARGGGTSNINITSGGAAEIDAELASAAESTESAENLDITKAGYDQGYREYSQAIGGEEDLAAGWNPNSFAGSADASGKVASDQANTIAAQQNSLWNGVIGALGGVAANFSTPGGWSL